MNKNDKNNGVDDTDVIDHHIPPTDEVNAVPKPANLGEPWKGKECDAAGKEQVKLHEAEGIAEATAPDVTVAELERARQTDHQRLEAAEAINAGTEAEYDDAAKKLQPYVNRPANAKRLYWIRLVLLLLGDVAAIAGACLLLGETRFNAYGQALSAATAAITLGAIGSETKRQVQSRARAGYWNDLDDSYARYRHLFLGRSDADRLIRVVTAWAGLRIALIAVAVFELRDATEGSAAAFTFGLIAAAVGLASFVNSYTTTCDVSEYLDVVKARLLATRAYLEACRDSIVIKQHDGAVAAARVIKEKWAAKGEAARLAREREKWAIYGANPIILGHGEAAAPPASSHIQKVTDTDEEAA
jgi:hypothetical protein